MNQSCQSNRTPSAFIMSVLIVISVITAVYFACVTYFKKKYSYWESRGIKGPKPWPLVGNFGSIMFVQQSVDEVFRKAYNIYPDEKVVGLYRGVKPILLLRDPDVIKQVLIKDFHFFQDRGINAGPKRFNQHLFALEGEPWKILRHKLTPMFTSGKLKGMMPLLQKCADDYVTYVTKLVDNNIDHEIRSLTGKYTLEVIGSCAFGLNLGCLSDEETEFGRTAKRVFSPSITARIWMGLDMLLPGIRKIFPNLSDTSEDLKIFFVDLVTKIINDRDGRPTSRKDFMDFMVELREQGKVSRRKEDGEVEMEIDDEIIAAQALLFYSAGYETSSATMSFLIHELAVNQDIQERAYKEVCEVYEKYSGFPYEALYEMTYIDMLLDAALRRHPVAGALMRNTLADYKLPGTTLTIEKNTRVFISIGGLHHDPKYFPDPEKFNPEVFSPENKRNIPQCAFMPFGDGPRNCIGLRFAKVESIIGMAAFIKNFKVAPSDKTKKVLTYDPKGLTLTAHDGIWVKIFKR